MTFDISHCTLKYCDDIIADDTVVGWVDYNGSYYPPAFEMEKSVKMGKGGKHERRHALMDGLLSEVFPRARAAN